MVDLRFKIEGAEAERFSVSPLLIFFLRVETELQRRVDSIMLNCQIRIDATRRAYSAVERERLGELFGAPERWSETLRSLLWAQVSIVVPRFEGETTVRLAAPCTYDFCVASAKYFYGVTDGEIPLTFLFSGSLFFKDEPGSLQIEQISWSTEANYRMPVELWREAMEMHYPNGVLLRLDAEAFDRLYRFKRRRGLLGFEEALATLLDTAEAET
ncbi:DUF6084 family protein [Methylocystis bryophila]|uniref:Uncharacterized protein n=1 Tax=Methylocystis bryophila TaxID=655015 RepID=A0A1W6MUM5_9HYPH|nr:DUF6084 family protein [Methylocystis bryophila]ARN81189.1 hypothetical protein B1812_08950 [Methylocystis bryophila]BDV37127.1 hypothetical protein DSM21852_03800 [Methylocystis bryophila]